MTWVPFDCHAHSTWSDGELEVDALIERVHQRGVRPSVADHVSRDVVGAIDTLERFDAYLEVLESREVGRGAEFCWHDALWRDVSPAQHARLTHTIGSLHAVWLANGELQRVFTRQWPDDLTSEVYMDAHLDNVERFAREMTVDILAHPTLVPLRLQRIPSEELWSESHEERLVRALHDSGIAFEVSSRYRPHERLVRRAVAAGARLSLGSDGHAAEQVGDIGFSLALVRSLGVADSDLYDPTSHGRRPIDGRPR